MENSDPVQPVDGYVKTLLEHARKKYNIDVDSYHPTHSQRLNAAVAMHNEGNGHYSIKIMTGKRIGMSDPIMPTLAFLMIAEAMNSNPNLRRYYDGFPHRYTPEK